MTTKPRRSKAPTSPGPWRIGMVDTPGRFWREGDRGRAGWWTSEPGIATPYTSYAEACEQIKAMLKDGAIYASLALAVEVK